MAEIVTIDTKTRASLADQFKILVEEMTRQNEMIVNGLNNTSAPGIEYAPTFQNEEKLMVEYVKNKLAASISFSILNQLIGDLDGFVVDKEFQTMNPKALITAKGGYYGEFLEREFLGLPSQNTDPGPDLKYIKNIVLGQPFTSPYVLQGIELKGTLSSDKIGVGGISTVDVLNDGGAALEAEMLTFYKMAKKMQNFLLMQIEEVGGVLTKGSSHHIRFKLIYLFMFLILQKLYDELFDKTKRMGVVQMSSGHWKPTHMEGNVQLGIRTYNVTLSLSKTNEVFRFAQLYLYHHNFLPDIKGNGSQRKEFFAAIRDMKLASLGNENIGGFDVVP